MATTTPSRYALILAGGSGQRFWPISRDALPKQLLQLFGEKTLLELTVERLKGIVPTKNILILTNTQQEVMVRKLLPQLPKENIIAEPEKRDTAPAIALGVGWVAAREPSATMMVLPADHLIQDEAAFKKVLLASAFAATISKQFGKLPKLSIDYALMEKASRVLNVEATFDWDDVGNWTSVGRYLDKDEDGNQHNCKLAKFDASGNIVFTQMDNHVALLGVQDLIVVQAKDAILIASKSHAESIKKLVDQLPQALR